MSETTPETSDLRECHEEVADQFGYAEPCDETAVGWRIDPEENQPYPVCALHHRWPYADEWVEARAEVERLAQEIAAAEQRWREERNQALDLLAQRTSEKWQAEDQRDALRARLDALHFTSDD